MITTPELLATAAAAAGGALHLWHLIVVGSGRAQLPAHVRCTDFGELESARAGTISSRSDDDLAALMYTRRHYRPGQRSNALTPQSIPLFRQLI